MSDEKELTEIHPTLDGIALTLEKSGKVFKAILKESAISAANRDCQPGSRVRVICFADGRATVRAA